MRAGIYLRISKDRNGLGEGVERQLEDDLALCGRNGWDESNGWERPEIYMDNDTGASRWSKKQVRPDYDRLIADVESGYLNAIATYHPERLYRKVRTLMDLVPLIEETGVQVGTCVGGAVDLTTASGRRNAMLGAVIAEGEADQTRERVLRQKQQRAEKGLPPGGTRRFGYTPKWKIDPAEAALIRKAATQIIAGASIRSIAADWNAKGVHAPSGKPYSPAGLSRLMKYEYLAGKRVHQGKVIGQGTWTPILDAKMWKGLQKILTNPARVEHQGTARKHFLAGLLTCSKCGSTMYSGVNMRKNNQGNYRVYMCKKTANSPDACGGMLVKAEPLEAFITDATIRLLLRSKHLRTGLRNESAHGAELAIATLARLEAEQRELADDYYRHKRIPRAIYEDQADEITWKLEAAQAVVKRFQDQGAISALPDDEAGLRALWNGSLDVRHKLTRRLFEKIEILPARVKGAPFGPERVRPTKAPTP
jgi:site-specific DNA recombinase